MLPDCMTGGVAADTLVLTSSGYVAIDTLQGAVRIWDGQGWARAAPRKLGQAELVRVTLDNGMKLDCTADVDWWVPGDTRSAGQLLQGDALAPWRTPVVQCTDTDEFRQPYTHAFWSLAGTFVGPHFMAATINKPRYTVPVNYSLATRMTWLAGLLDAQGTTYLSGGCVGLQVVADQRAFLEAVQLLLTTLGVVAVLVRSADQWQLTVAPRELQALRSLGLSSRKLWLGSPLETTCSDAARTVRVVEVVRHSTEDVYDMGFPCLGVLNGILLR